ncbi:hypothetical protein EDEG_01267 [Edhazardia aedis USNM 41457]|uniref:biotin carboxylase n=1 Tax=Edhazardia aedis (strain USNM 41457) TaxID=1003232 RepID=J9DAG5_EDHAE|nr:hypothetical protein EDEG_01267 [Edhazardia aedis USNM 41457]|eukprot:EJW04499.1 hypothetical protein EDEG_01267 [Edhazardia aedis USNM 41457]
MNMVGDKNMCTKICAKLGVNIIPYIDFGNKDFENVNGFEDVKNEITQDDWNVEFSKQCNKEVKGGCSRFFSKIKNKLIRKGCENKKDGCEIVLDRSKYVIQADKEERNANCNNVQMNKDEKNLNYKNIQTNEEEKNSKFDRIVMEDKEENLNHNNIQIDEEKNIGFNSIQLENKNLDLNGIVIEDKKDSNLDSTNEFKILERENKDLIEMAKKRYGNTIVNIYLKRLKKKGIEATRKEICKFRNYFNKRNDDKLSGNDNLNSNDDVNTGTDSMIDKAIINNIGNLITNSTSNININNINKTYLNSNENKNKSITDGKSMNKDSEHLVKNTACINKNKKTDDYVTDFSKLNIHEGNTGDNKLHIEKIIRKFSESNGFPLLLKASLSGGGKGIRMINTNSEAINTYETCLKEGGGEMMLCKVIDNARHVELQMARDKFGNILFLGTRDCTIQRRHQKLIEESTSKDIFYSKYIREMEKDARKILDYSKYEGVATVEFLCTTEAYYFLEINTRIQVEHPVTEFKYNINIPEIQYLIALNQSIRHYKVRKSKKHVLAIRIIAENPYNNFFPQTGSVKIVPYYDKNVFMYFNSTDGVICKFNDSQFGHIFVKEKTRTLCIQKALKVLSKIRIHGVSTVIECIKRILKSKVFQQNDYNTKTFENAVALCNKLISDKNISKERLLHLYRSYNETKISQDVLCNNMHHKDFFENHDRNYSYDNLSYNNAFINHETNTRINSDDFIKVMAMHNINNPYINLPPHNLSKNQKIRKEVAEFYKNYPARTNNTRNNHSKHFSTHKSAHNPLYSFNSSHENFNRLNRTDIRSKESCQIQTHKNNVKNNNLDFENNDLSKMLHRYQSRNNKSNNSLETNKTYNNMQSNGYNFNQQQNVGIDVSKTNNLCDNNDTKSINLKKNNLNVTNKSDSKNYSHNIKAQNNNNIINKDNNVNYIFDNHIKNRQIIRHHKKVTIEDIKNTYYNQKSFQDSQMNFNCKKNLNFIDSFKMSCINDIDDFEYKNIVKNIDFLVFLVDLEQKHPYLFDKTYKLDTENIFNEIKNSLNLSEKNSFNFNINTCKDQLNTLYNNRNINVNDFYSNKAKSRIFKFKKIEPIMSFSMLFTLQKYDITANFDQTTQIPQKMLSEASTKTKFIYENEIYEIITFLINPNTICLTTNDTFEIVSFEILDKKVFLFNNDKWSSCSLISKNNTFTLFFDDGVHTFSTENDNGLIKAPSDGKIVKFHCKNNQKVNKGTVLLEIEIMKMRIPLISTSKGKISIDTSKIYVKEGDVIGKIISDDIEEQLSNSKFTFNNKIYIKKPCIADTENKIVYDPNQTLKKYTFDPNQYNKNNIYDHIQSDIKNSTYNLNQNTNKFDNSNTYDTKNNNAVSEDLSIYLFTPKIDHTCYKKDVSNTLNKHKHINTTIQKPNDPIDEQITLKNLAFWLKGYQAPDFLIKSIQSKNFTCNDLIAFIKFYSKSQYQSKTTDKIVEIILRKTLEYFKADKEIEIKESLIEVITFVDKIIIKRKFPKEIFFLFTDLRKLICEYKFKLSNFYYDSSVSEQKIFDYLKRSCSYRESLLFVLQKCMDYQELLLKKYFSNILKLTCDKIGIKCSFNKNGHFCLCKNNTNGIINTKNNESNIFTTNNTINNTCNINHVNTNKCVDNKLVNKSTYQSTSENNENLKSQIKAITDNKICKNTKKTLTFEKDKNNINCLFCHSNTNCGDLDGIKTIHYNCKTNKKIEFLIQTHQEAPFVTYLYKNNTYCRDTVLINFLSNN